MSKEVLSDIEKLPKHEKEHRLGSIRDKHGDNSLDAFYVEDTLLDYSIKPDAVQGPMSFIWKGATLI